MSYAGETDTALEAIPLAAVNLSVNQLEDFAFLIPQFPASDLAARIERFRAKKALDIVPFETAAILLVQELYPRAPPDLLQLLSSSMTDRYVKLLYWQSRDGKLRNNTRHTNSIPESLDESNRSPELHLDPQLAPRRAAVSETEPSMVPSHVPTDLLDIGRRYDAYVSNRASSVQVGKIDYPPPPKAGNNVNQLKCPFCRELITRDDFEPIDNWR